MGFTYSSSVLPAKNPLYGWETFGTDHKKINGVWELPITLTNTPFLNIPFAGGIYFRNLPKKIIMTYFKKTQKTNNTVIGYFHPYDIDTEQEYFMHPDINNNIIFNKLMYRGRNTVLNKLDTIIKTGWKIKTYEKHILSLE